MKKLSAAIVMAGFILGLGSFAADRLAIAEPISKGGMSPKEIEAVWSMLEASVDGGFELISRSAIKAMMTEIGLTTSSDLVNLNSSQKARLGEIKTVKYLLVPTISKFGSRINFSLVMVDSSSGNIDPDKKVSETFDSLDEMSDKLKDTLAEIGLGTASRKRGKSAMLTPVVRVPAPAHVAEEFNAGLEEALLAGGIRLQNLRSVAGILRKNNIGSLNEVEPAMYRRIGELLRVDYLVQAVISRFSCRFQRVYIEVTRNYADRCIGDIEGYVCIISARTGEITGTFRFRQNVDFAQLYGKEDWTIRDYEKYLIDKVLPQVSARVIGRLKQ